MIVSGLDKCLQNTQPVRSLVPVICTLLQQLHDNSIGCFQLQGHQEGRSATFINRIHLEAWMTDNSIENTFLNSQLASHFKISHQQVPLFFVEMLIWVLGAEELCKVAPVINIFNMGRDGLSELHDFFRIFTHSINDLDCRP